MRYNSHPFSAAPGSWTGYRRGSAGDRLRREVHEGWPLDLEGTWRRDQTARGRNTREWSV